MSTPPPRNPRPVNGDWPPCPSASSGHSTSASSANLEPIDTPTGGDEIGDDWRVEVSDIKRVLHDVSNKVGSSTATAKRRIDKTKYQTERLAKHVNNQLRVTRKVSAASDDNFQDAAQDRKVAFAKLISLEKMVGRLDERMGRLEERMGRLEERMGRQDENICRLLERLDVAAEPAHSFADGEGGVLVLQVKLPGLSSISEVALDVSADGFDLSSPSFALRLAWPRAVDANGAKAKFLRKSGVLQVTLPGAGTSSEPR